MTINAVFQKGAVVLDASDFSEETTSASIVEISTGCKSITLTSCKHRPIFKDKTSTANCTYLPYAPGAINYVNPQGVDVLSSRFTGCWLAKYKVGGEVRVAHVATPECNDLWAKMQSQSGFELICAFKPTDIVDTKQQISMLNKAKLNGSLIIGVITNDDKCYAGFGGYALNTKTSESPYTSLIWKSMN